MQDAIVVGAGMAGSAAALKLSRAGIRSVVFEARDRVGGRGYLKPFGGEGEALEYGGAWITPTHGRIRSLVKELGLALRPRHPVTRRLWLRDGEIHDSGPTSEQDRAAHERALARVAADALLLKKGHREDEKGRPLTGVTFADYLDRLNAPPATRALFSAWWTVSGSGDHRRVAASEFLASCTYADGLAEGMIEVWADTVVPGMAALAQRMLDASGATLHLSTPVKAIDQDTDGVSVTTANGTTLRARHAVLAMGVNQMQAIRFSPPLPEGKAKIVAARHGGRAFKLWLKVKGVPVGTLVTGDGTGIEWAFAERESADGSTLVVAFGIMREENRPGDRAWVEAETRRLFPNAYLVAYDWNDWLNDAYANGTWVAAPAGLEDLLEAHAWRPEGRVLFASSDYAREQAGWFEAAVISGEDAAQAIIDCMKGTAA
ncbi:MAG: NAD(P)/FAD-dependent oxidoreductase [Hyphomicrobiales bacterium]